MTDITLLDFVPKELKEKHGESYRKSIAASGEALEAIIKKQSEITCNYPAIKAMLNISQFVLLYNVDFLILLRRFALSESIWEINLNARFTSILLYDFLFANSTLWTDFNSNMTKVYNDKDGPIELKKLYSALRIMRRDNSKMLERIRNKTIAHRLSDAEEQFDILKKIELESIMRLNLKIVGILNKYALLLTDFFVKNKKLH